MEQMNEGFGIPAALTVGETEEQRMARLQQLADLAISKESDASRNVVLSR